MSKEITALKINKWLNTKTMEMSFGIDGKVDHLWYHLSMNGKPLWYPTEYQARKAIKRMKEEAFSAIRVYSRKHGRQLSISSK